MEGLGTFSQLGLGKEAHEVTNKKRESDDSVKIQCLSSLQFLTKSDEEKLIEVSINNNLKLYFYNFII